MGGPLRVGGFVRPVDRRERRRRSVLLGVLLSAFVSSTASAHVGHVILRAERYLKLDVGGRSVRLVVSLTLGPAEGERVLEAADTSGDGHVDEAESDAYLAQWAEGLREELPVRVGSSVVAVDYRDGYLDPLGQVRPTPVTVELVGHFELPGGEQTIRVEDRMVRREVFERTDVAFRARDGAVLIASGADEVPTEVTAELAYGPGLRPQQPVPLTAIVQTPAAPPAVDGDTALKMGAGAVAVLALLVYLVARRRRI